MYVCTFGLVKSKKLVSFPKSALNLSTYSPEGHQHQFDAPHKGDFTIDRKEQNNAVLVAAVISSKEGTNFDGVVSL